MSLSQYNFVATKIRELQSWFLDVYNHLSAKNYANSGTRGWTPVFTGLTGSPTVTAWYQRFGTKCEVSIEMDGATDITNGTITVPITPIEGGDGVFTIFSKTDNSPMGVAYMDSVIKIRRLWVTNEIIEIRGTYEVAGI